MAAICIQHTGVLSVCYIPTDPSNAPLGWRLIAAIANSNLFAQPHHVRYANVLPFERARIEANLDGEGSAITLLAVKHLITAAHRTGLFRDTSSQLAL